MALSEHFLEEVSEPDMQGEEGNGGREGRGQLSLSRMAWVTAEHGSWVAGGEGRAQTLCNDPLLVQEEPDGKTPTQFPQ